MLRKWIHFPISGRDPAREQQPGALARPRRRTWLTWKRFCLALLWTGLALLLLIGLPNLLVDRYAGPRLYSAENAPASRVAIVFGAGLTRSGDPSAVLRDRVEMAVRLYKAGKVDKILMSGDNRFVYYNEPGAMREYAIQLGVPGHDIVLDYAGRRTYDTCYRARFIFEVREAILVTQNFHIARALYTCNSLGLRSVGVPAQIRRYGRRISTIWAVREVPAKAVAVWEVWVSRPLPVLGNPEPIFPGRVTELKLDF